MRTYIHGYKSPFDLAITSGRVPIRRFRVEERYERVGWRHLWKWCGWADSDDLPRSMVVVNAWTKKCARRQLEWLWFEHVRFVMEDVESVLLVEFREVPA